MRPRSGHCQLPSGKQQPLRPAPTTVLRRANSPPPNVSDSPRADDDVAGALACHHDPLGPHRGWSLDGPHHGRHAADRPRHPAHDDAALARHPGRRDPVHRPAATRSDHGHPGQPPHRDASAHGRRHGRPCHLVPAPVSTVVLDPAHDDQNARPPVRHRGPVDHGETAPQRGPYSAALAGHVRRCPDQAHQRARHRPHATCAPAPACWDAPPGWGHVPATTGTTRSRRQQPS